MTYTVEITGLPHTRKAVVADSADQAVARFHADIAGRSVIPSETIVYAKREKLVYGPQKVINAVATEYGTARYDYLDLI